MELFCKVDSPLADRHVAFDLFPEQGQSLLKVCLVADKSTAQPIELFSSALYSVYLGVVLDRSLCVRQKLEVVVESRHGIEQSFDSRYAALTNSTLDYQWDQFSKGALSSGGTIISGLESVPGTPLILDYETGSSSYLTNNESGEKWVLCREDHLLKEAGFDSYSTSLQRYLYTPGNIESGFVAVESGSDGARTMTLDNLVNHSEQQKFFNDQAGRMFLREYKALSFKEYDSLLGDLLLDETELGPESLRGEGKFKESGGLNGRLFTAHHSSKVNYSEILHLKLSALADIAGEVQGVTERTGVPFFNLNTDSFSVKINAQGRGLPYLWAASAELARPGCGVACTLPGTDDKLFINSEKGISSVFKPKSVGGQQKGEATLNFHQVLNDVDNSLQLAGTLRVNERIDLDETDMVWLRLVNSDLRIDIFCNFDEQHSEDGVRHFKTVMRAFTAQEKSWLIENLGIPLDRTYWEVVPVVSSPYDLYSLGVIFVSSLLSNNSQSLGVSLDHVLHLAKRCSEKGVGSDLSETVAEVFSEDDQLWQTLGPHLLTNESNISSRLIPEELWFKVLAVTLKMFPGFPGVSHAAGLADVSAALSTVFDTPVAEVNSLVGLTRSMLLGNWDLNIEISQVLNKFK